MEAQNQPEKAGALLKEVLAQVGSGMFMYRRDAEALLKKLVDSGVMIPTSGIPTDPGPGATAPTGGAGQPTPTNPTPTTPPAGAASPAGTTPNSP
jgi:hypothetical protein